MSAQTPDARAAELDRWFPPRGPCAFCGCDDARHRLFDVLKGMHAAGDSVEVLAAAYALPGDAVRAALAAGEGG